MVYNNYMKIGLLYLNEIKYDDLAWVFVKNGIDAEIIDTGISVYSVDEGDALKVSGLLQSSSIGIAITMDFCPAVSDACMKCGIKYVAWINDAPQQALFNKQITNKCNYIFSFDKKQVEEMKASGGTNVYHLPLATNVLRNTGLVIEESDISRYTCDISFIGSLYFDDNYDKVYSLASEDTQKEIDEIVSEATGKWDGTNRIGGRLSESAIGELARICMYESKDEFSMPAEKYLSEGIITRRIAHNERLAIARMLSGYDFRLYTNSNMQIDGVSTWPRLDYENELPKAYHLSRINLNIALHSITSGIPLRVFDIMGVGGFMLTNYQPEIEDLFTIGKDIEVFRCMEELEDKVRFYLKHEEKRVNIALNGYRTVSEKYNYENAYNTIVSMIGK